MSIYHLKSKSMLTTLVLGNEIDMKDVVGAMLGLFLILTVHHPARLFSESPNVSSESPH